MRTPLVAANFKMHAVPMAAFDSNSTYRTSTDVEVVVFPTALEVSACLHAQLVTGGQWGYHEAEGARTGDISMAQLAKAGCHYVLCGHSERREHYHETDELIAEQVIAALEAKLHPVICIGETAEQRKAGRAQQVIEKQLKNMPLSSNLTIAYEPIWAIGTGDSATPAQAEEMHAFIRSLLPADRQGETRILYGGSVNAENARALFAAENIDGGLVGSAALDPEEFRAIVAAAQK